MYGAPIFDKETRIHFHKLKIYLLRMFYILAFGAIFMVTIPGGGGVERLYQMVFWMMLTAALFVGPAFGAATIANEKKQNTLGILFLTDLSPGEIVVGKFLSRFAYLALIILSGFPLLILGVALGGVTYLDVVAVILIVLTLLFLSTAVSLFFSVLLKRNIMVMIFSYIALVAIEGLPALIGGETGWYSAPVAVYRISHELALDDFGFGYVWVTVLYSLIFGAALLLLSASMIKRATDWDFFSAISGLLRKSDRVAGFLSFDNFGMTEVQWSAKFKNPFAWKETNARLFLRGRYLVRIIAFLVITSCVVYVGFSDMMITTDYSGNIIPSMGFQRTFLALEGVLLVLIVTVLASSSIIAEKENQVIDVLLSTPMQPVTLVTGKFYGILRNMAFFAFLPVMHIAVFSFAGAVNIANVFTYLLFLYTVIAMAISQGLYISLHAKTTVSAVIVGMLANLYLMIGIVIWSYTAVFRSRGTSEDVVISAVVLGIILLSIWGLAALILKKTREKFLVVLREKDIDFDELLAG